MRVNFLEKMRKEKRENEKCLLAVTWTSFLIDPYLPAASQYSHPNNSFVRQSSNVVFPSRIYHTTSPARSWSRKAKARARAKAKAPS